jgi:quercetin dioxygenase-like cupin family protein
MSAKTRSIPARAKAATTLEVLLDKNAEMLVHLAPEAAAPAPDIKARLLARVRAASQPQPNLKIEESVVPSGWRFESASAVAGWFPLPFPGVRMKQLSADVARDVMQILVEIAPGARFPDHDHVAGDEGIVLSGDVMSGGRLLRAGDYYYAGAGTKHTDIVSPSGCVAMVSMTVTGWHRWRAEVLAKAGKS